MHNTKKLFMVQGSFIAFLSFDVIAQHFYTFVAVQTEDVIHLDQFLCRIAALLWSHMFNPAPTQIT